MKTKIQEWMEEIVREDLKENQHSTSKKPVEMKEHMVKHTRRVEQFIHTMGIVEEEGIVSLTDLEEREEVILCQKYSNE